MCDLVDQEFAGRKKIHKKAQFSENIFKMAALCPLVATSHIHVHVLVVGKTEKRLNKLFLRYKHALIWICCSGPV